MESASRRRIYAIPTNKLDCEDFTVQRGGAMDGNTWTNERGNQVTNKSSFCSSRYVYDLKLCPPREGWEQFDTWQDAEYFGIWCNKEKLTIVTYAEGDETTVVCPDAEHYDAEIASMCQFYEPGCFAATIGTDGKVTKYYQDRQQFFTTYVAPPTEDELAKVPSNIRKAAERICSEFNIKGICDPMYVCNIIAFELGYGDGCSNFHQSDFNPHCTREDLRRLADRLNSSYATCVDGRDTYQILEEEL